MSNNHVAYIKSKEINEYMRYVDQKGNFGGMLIKRNTVDYTDRAYKIIESIFHHEESEKKRLDIMQEYINYLLVKANKVPSDIKVKEIKEEANYLLKLISDKLVEGDQNLQSVLLKNSLSSDQLYNVLSQQALLRIAKQRISTSVKVTNEDAKEYYRQNKNSYTTPPKVQIKLITLSDKSIADKVWAYINSSKDFDKAIIELEREYKVAEKTELLWISSGQLNVELEKAIFDMEIGEKRGIVTTSQGYHIIKVENVVESQLLEFEAIIDKVKADIKKLYVIDSWKEYISQLRAKTRIIIWH